MNGIAKHLGDAWGTFKHIVAVWAAETAHDITLIEAIDTHSFQAELRAVASTEAERKAIRNAALEVAKLGLTHEDLHPMARMYLMARQFDITTEDVIELARARTRGEA